MKQRTNSLLWLLSIASLIVFSGLSWLDLTLTPEIGGQFVQVSGNLVFPVISALILLQASGLLAAFFTPNSVSRVIAATLAITMSAHLVYVATLLQQQLQVALAGQITEITGVVGIASQSQLVASAETTIMWALYLVCVGLNVAILAIRTLLKSERKIKPATLIADEATDLWETQK
jgi:hypothetical protein